ncbi:tRNA pseudouridine(38/39) synthase [Vespula pensylvanica]|uniref:Pseudouridine synthase I TruA alpha/beta domain-containing protein n=1 Tax=Vespula pensylvanica TaxID=30213 RepID=A0A834KLC5_VESPE|nr:tRNA pseudouridine(38/39) synthase [Vespula pensylvanica]KAF7406904.1 hypothetical protein H0235_014560 [Vespula pensylvanica]
MAKVITKKKKLKRLSTKEELELSDKSELIDKILQLEAYNMQLQTILKKTETHEMERTKCHNKTQKQFDFTKCHKRHILLKLYYLGWDYDGFTCQEGNNNTIEHHLFSALIKSCCIESREKANYHRCGRTDKGVSAFSQVISLDIRSKLEPEKQSDLQNELSYCKILNRLLPQNIRCIAWSPVPSDFSARFNCKDRTYKYIFPRGKLNIDAMNKAAKYTIGTHDFRNICKMDVANGVINFKRRIIDATVSVKQNDYNNPGYDICELKITSQAFLWHQIRCLMGVLLLVGQEKEKPEIILKLLDIDSYPCKPQYNLACEIPLNLYHSEYENIKWFYDKDEFIKVIKILQQDWSINTVKSAMIKDMLMDLESLQNCTDTTFQNDCLLLGVHSKVYQPLMERVTCESLENRIKHYQKKGKFELMDLSNM